jgi:hypothetical protein
MRILLSLNIAKISKNTNNAPKNFKAVDPDERPLLKYTLSSNDYFIINETSGVIMVQRSLLNVDEEMFELEVKVSDGKNEVKAPLKVSFFTWVCFCLV